MLRSLHFKIGSGVIATVVLLSTLYLILDYRFYRSQLYAQLEQSATSVSEITLQSLLELAMIGQHPELLQKAIQRLGSEPSIAAIYVLDLSGEARFASRLSDLGRQFHPSDPGCGICHADNVERAVRTVFYELEGERILRNIRPVPNQPQCHSCHESNQQVNGILVVDFSTEHLQAQLRAGLYEVLVKAGLTLSAILAVLGILMNRLVILRLKKLARATVLFAQKKQDPGWPVFAGEDEIGQLARSFQRMASDVQTFIRELENQKSYLQSLINSLQDGLVVVDAQLRITLTNRAASGNWQGRQLTDLLLESSSSETVRKGVQKAFQGEFSPREVVLQNENEKKFLEIHFSAVKDREDRATRVIVLFRDITERKSFEMQISRAERLASVGQLAAGLAHEINNPMAAITTCMEGLSNQVDTLNRLSCRQRKEIQDYLNTIGEAAGRCSEITRRLLNLSAERELELQQVELQEVVRDVISLVEYDAQRKGVCFVASCEPNTGLWADRERMHQLLLNLVLNSLEAVGEEGRIEVTVKRIDGSVKLEVADNGRGIHESCLERIFDPFFTTKRHG
jgi:two-component system, NtrC family, sensor kinase